MKKNNIETEFRKKNVGVNVGLNVGVNSIQRKILELIEQNQNITQKEIASKLKTTVRTIERNINVLKEKDILKRIGTDEVGLWEIRDKFEK